jgi:CHAP domain
MKTSLKLVVVPVLVLAAACGGGTSGTSEAQPASELVSRSVGADGGIILLPDGTSLSIPKGAVKHEVTFTIETNPSAAAVAGVSATGLTYLFGPEGQTFETPVTVTLAIDSSLLPSGASPSDITIFTAPRDSADYVTLPTTMVDSLHVAATTTHFSNFSTGASHLGSINPDNPMTDADMTGGQEITVAKMQSFLESERSALADFVDPSSHKTAAEIIVNESHAHGLSPVYMLARLQSEEGLVESSRGWDKGELDVRLDSATGCACPSTCDKSLSGFRTQIECAASNTATYMKDAEHGGETVSGWRVGHEKTTLDHCTVRPVNAATAALYTYTPYEGYEDSNRYCAGAKELTAAGEDGLEVTGLAMLFYKYAKSFPGSLSSSSSSSTCSGSSLGESIAKLAKANEGRGACEKNSLGGAGYSTKGAWGDSCTGNACDGRSLPEFWCADFATWVWAHAGALHPTALGDSADSFATYGKTYHTSKKDKAEVGDAVVFDSGAHVAIVVQANSDGTIETESGDWGGDCATSSSCECEAAFSSTSHVVHNTPAYEGKVGKYSNTMGMTITAIVSPVLGSTTSSCKGSGDTGGVAAPTGPSADDVCCAKCNGESSSYYAAQVKDSSGKLATCEDAAKDFCQYSFGTGVSDAAMGTCPVYDTGSGGTTAK